MNIEKEFLAEECGVDRDKLNYKEENKKQDWEEDFNKIFVECKVGNKCRYLRAEAPDVEAFIKKTINNRELEMQKNAMEYLKKLCWSAKDIGYFLIELHK